MLTAFHAPPDGQTEQVNSSVEQYIHVFVNRQQDDWVQYSPWRSLLLILGLLSQHSVPYFLRYEGWTPGWHSKESRRGNEINDIGMRITFNLRFNRFMNTCVLR
jgi:hypothetical protein